MTNDARRKAIQEILGVKADGGFGPKTRAAFESLAVASDEPVSHVVTASSFADPADVAAFRRCKAKGGTDQECFRVGDNGIGAFGHDTTGPQPMVALPPEVWKAAGKTGGAKVRVSFNGKSVEAILGDTMPHEQNVKNGAGIDLNPACASALGLKPPFMQPGVSWEWI